MPAPTAPAGGAPGHDVVRDCQAWLQAIYRTQAPDIAAYLVDVEAVRSVLGPDTRAADEWVLVHEAEGELSLAVYLDQALLAALHAARTPRRALEASFRAFCAAIEGVSHFLLLVERARRGEPVSMLELEAQAEVDKYVCARLHAPDRSAEWRDRLFRRASLAEGLSTEERHRYQEAGRLADGWCRHLEDLPHTGAVLDTQREFWRCSGAQRLDRMRRQAA